VTEGSSGRIESAASRHANKLVVVLILTACFAGIEASVALATNSLVLAADAAHMFTDVVAVAMSLGAILLARRPADRKRTYGYYRLEVLAALLNAALLLGVSAFVLFAAIQRMQDPGEAPGPAVLVMASIGLLVNLVAARLLQAGATESLNVRSAFLEIVSDLLGSAAAVAAGIIMLMTGWRYADPVFAIIIAILIWPRAITLILSALDVLMEGAPAHIKIADVQQAIIGTPRALAVHDLHVWTVSDGFVALSGHVEVSDNEDCDQLLVDLKDRLSREFGITHVTLQLEHERLRGKLDQPCFPDQASCYAEPEQVVKFRSNGRKG
jgi:cobalt-zinc-cadmium efflux system protein